MLLLILLLVASVTFKCSVSRQKLKEDIARDRAEFKAKQVRISGSETYGGNF